MGCLEIQVATSKASQLFVLFDPQKESTILPSYCVLVFLSRSEMPFVAMNIKYMRPFVGLELIIFSMMSEILETARQ